MSSKNVSSFQLGDELFNSCEISENHVLKICFTYTDLWKPYEIDSLVPNASLSAYFV